MNYGKIDNLFKDLNKMKVLLVNGSPRQQGNTATALAEVARQLTLEGIDCETMWIGNKPVRGCIACGQCAAQGLGRCVFDDDVSFGISIVRQKENMEFFRTDGEIFGIKAF